MTSVQLILAAAAAVASDSHQPTLLGPVGPRADRQGYSDRQPPALFLRLWSTVGTPSSVRPKERRPSILPLAGVTDVQFF